MNPKHRNVRASKEAYIQELSPCPAFMIACVPRAGTTSLLGNLAANPNVHALSLRREVNYFVFGRHRARGRGPGDRTGIDSKRDYLCAINEADPGQIIGESSTLTAYFPGALQELSRLSNPPYLLGIFREPVERAYSHFLQHRRMGREPYSDFGVALENEAKRLRAGWSPYWGYAELSRYRYIVQNIQDHFFRDKFMTLRFEDIVYRPAHCVQQVESFLGLPCEKAGDFQWMRENPGGELPTSGIGRLLWSRNRATQTLGYLLPKTMKRYIKKLKYDFLKRPVLDSGLRRELREEFRPDVDGLEVFTGWDLGSWRSEV